MQGLFNVTAVSGPVSRDWIRPWQSAQTGPTGAISLQAKHLMWGLDCPQAPASPTQGVFLQAMESHRPFSGSFPERGAHGWHHRRGLRWASPRSPAVCPLAGPAPTGPGLLLPSPRLQTARDSSAGQSGRTRSQVDLFSRKPLFLKHTVCLCTFAFWNECAGSWGWPQPPLLAPPGSQTAELLQLAAKLSPWVLPGSTPPPPSEPARFCNSLITHRWILCKVCVCVWGGSEQKLISLMSFALTDSPFVIILLSE